MELTDPPPQDGADCNDDSGGVLPRMAARKSVSAFDIGETLPVVDCG